MKRIIRKYWDETNGRLITYYYRVWKDAMVEIVFESPVMLSCPEDAKGKMSSIKRDGKIVKTWYSRGQIARLLSVFLELDQY